MKLKKYVWVLLLTAVMGMACMIGNANAEGESVSYGYYDETDKAWKTGTRTSGQYKEIESSTNDVYLGTHDGSYPLEEVGGGQRPAVLVCCNRYERGW